jgi:hypothetical protein
LSGAKALGYFDLTPHLTAPTQRFGRIAFDCKEQFSKRQVNCDATFVAFSWNESKAIGSAVAMLRREISFRLEQIASAGQERRF